MVLETFKTIDLWVKATLSLIFYVSPIIGVEPKEDCNLCE